MHLIVKRNFTQSLFEIMEQFRITMKSFNISKRETDVKRM
jgi:hypothetical protein